MSASSVPGAPARFKLVRLTATFPKIIYIVACDRDQVTKALAQGDRYLEKIVQIPFNLPEVSRYNLEEQTLGAIEAILAVPFDEDRVSYIVKLVILPLIKNMRDVRRYTATIQDTDSSGGKRTIHWTTSDVYTTRLLGTSPKLRPKVPRALSSLTRLRAFGAAGYDER